MQVKLSSGAISPTRGTVESAGYDLRALTDFKIPSDEQLLVSTGVRMKIPIGWVGLIKDRSSMAFKHKICTKAGVIDSDYRGEIKVLLHNYGEKSYSAKAGDKIAQMVILQCLITTPKIVDNLDETERGSGGFGSTGK